MSIRKYKECECGYTLRDRVVSHGEEKVDLICINCGAIRAGKYPSSEHKKMETVIASSDSWMDDIYILTTNEGWKMPAEVHERGLNILIKKRTKNITFWLENPPTSRHIVKITTH